MNTAKPFGARSRPIIDTSNSGSSPRDCFRSSPPRNPRWSGSPSARGYAPSGQGWPPPNRSWPLPSAIPSRNFSQVPPTPQSSCNSSATALICPEPKEPAWRHESKTLTYRYSQVSITNRQLRQWPHRTHRRMPGGLGAGPVWSSELLDRHLSLGLHLGVEQAELDGK